MGKKSKLGTKTENPNKDRVANNAENDNSGLAISVVQTAVLMAMLTLGSKVFGFIREMIMAGFYGTNYITDAYVMAQSIPNIMFAGIFGAVATAFMPLFSKKIEGEGLRSANLFTSQVINILLFASIISAIVGLIFSDQIVDIFASGFKGETARLTSFFVKVTFTYIIFSSVASLLDSFLQYKNVFLQQIVIGYTQNIIVICIIIISTFTSHYILAFGLLIAYIVRVILLWTLAIKKEFHYSPSINAKETVKIIIPLALPVFIGSSITQINMFMDRSLASGLQEGSVTALNYASLLNTMILALSVSVLTTIIYPKITQANALSDNQRLNNIVQRGFIIIFIIALPFSLGAMLYSEQIVQIVFERGAFDSAATMLTGSAYMYYSAGLLFMAINDLLIRVYYSKQDMKSPMIFGGICVIINITLNLILIRSMEHDGLALATSIAALCNSMLLYVGIKRRKSITLLESKTKVIKITIAALLAIGISYIVYLNIIIPFSNIIYMRVVQVGLTVCLTIINYLILLKIFKIEELNLVKQIFKRQ